MSTINETENHIAQIWIEVEYFCYSHGSRAERMARIDQAYGHAYDAVDGLAALRSIIRPAVKDDLLPPKVDAVVGAAWSALRSVVLEIRPQNLDLYDEFFEDVERFAQAFLIEHREQLRWATDRLVVLAGMGGDALEQVQTTPVKNKSGMIPADSVDRIEFEMKEGLEITISCSGHGQNKCTFPPWNGAITKQASLLLLVLNNRGTATLQEIAQGIYGEAYSRGEQPADIQRAIRDICAKINNRAGVNLLSFTWDGAQGKAEAATFNVVDRAKKREDNNSRLGTR